MSKTRRDLPRFYPTNARPGSYAKIEVLAARWEAGLPLWHPDDSFDEDIDGPFPSFSEVICGESDNGVDGSVDPRSSVEGSDDR